ncbi:hypothetical protein M1N50_03015 [Dehalococcoidia bacterium]|nr:hypothetical protein [Dehalococcoidia bacterium]MCL0058588.1 hypothetical protein [Dehalococcoidia bacterium]
MKKRLSLAILALLMVSLVAMGCPGLPKLDPPQDIHPPLVNLPCPPEKEWSRTFGGSGREWAASVQQTACGGFIIAGCTTSFGAGHADFWLIKTDAQGNKEWCQTFGGPMFDSASSVQETACGGFIIAGATESFGHGMGDFWLIKTNADGNKGWSQTFGELLFREKARSVQQTACGGLIIVGWTRCFRAEESDFFVVKTDAQGNKEWSRTFGGRRSERAHSVQQTACGGFIIAGSTFSFGAGRGDFWLVKTDPQGNKEWSRTFGGRWSESAASVQQTACGGFIIGGSIITRSAPAGVPVLPDLWLVKSDPQGNKEWSRTILYGDATSLQETACGGFIIPRWNDVVKTDALGNVEWRKLKGELTDEPGWPSVRSVQQTACGGFILAGSIDCRERNHEFFLVKLAPPK